MRIFAAVVIILLIVPPGGFSQQLEQRIQQLEGRKQEMLDSIQSLEESLESAYLQLNIATLHSVGLPTDDYIEHTAMILSYNEQHEVANWVAHVIHPNIIEGTLTRSNDFRPDTLIPGGSAVEEDYFLKYLQADSSYTYDGYGYDRGHLAPAADFRWSQTAMSESFLYSNMTPQRPSFNREIWADLESELRQYVVEEEVPIVVFTGGFLNSQLPKVQRSVNGVSIPGEYFKIAYDPANQRGIGFIVPHKNPTKPLSTYAVTIDEVEEKSGWDFYQELEEELQQKVESQRQPKVWLRMDDLEAEPIYPPDLPRGYFNTVQAKIYMGKNKKVSICGKVVSSRKSRSGNIWFNLDRAFPDQIFSVYIPKTSLVNFTHNPQKEWKQSRQCFNGKVMDFDGTPTMKIEKPSDVEAYRQEGLEE